MEVKPLVGNAEASQTLMARREGSQQPASIAGGGGGVKQSPTSAARHSALMPIN